MLLPPPRADYLRIRKHLYPDVTTRVEEMRPWAQRQREGEVVVWGTLEGFFWLPRELMDVERLGYAFFDQPELVHRINADLLDFNLGLWRQMKQVCVPTFLSLKESNKPHLLRLFSSGRRKQLRLWFF